MSAQTFKPDLSFFGGKRPCPECGSVKDREDFRKDKSGHSTTICLACEAKLAEVQEQHAYEGEARDALKTLALMFRGDKIEVPHTCELTAEVFRQFGGMEEVAKFIFQQSRQAAESNPGGKLAMDACKLLFGMVTRSTAQRGTAPDLQSLDDEALQTELKGLVTGLLESNPEIARVLIADASKSLKVFAPETKEAAG